MSLFKKAFGAAMGELLHVSAGIIITNFLIFYYHQTFTYVYYAVAILFAILPDADIIKALMALKNRAQEGLDSSHKFNFMHWPLVMLVLFIILVRLLTSSSFWMLLIILSLLSHYLIDSLQSGSYNVGIQWLAPFNYDFFRFSKPRWIKKDKIKFYVMDIEDWIDLIVLNPDYPELWINIGLFLISLWSFLLII